MKIVFMGTPDFSVGTLEALVKDGHELAAVVTQPDRPKGRGGAVQESPVKQCAVKHGIRVIQPLKARDEAFIKELREIAPDAIIVAAFGQLLPAEIINLPKYGCINVHASLLPKYRGASPIQWAVIDGCEYSGVTIMQMDEGLDTGDILDVVKVKLDKKETGGSLFDKLSDAGAKLIVETLRKIEMGKIIPVKQDEEKATYVSMLKKTFGEIDFNKSAVVIERLIRGLNPWPSAFCHIDGKMLKIWDADVVMDDEYEEYKPGMIIKKDNNSFMVKCAEGCLKINELQLEGKRRMKTEDFLRGYKLTDGSML